MIIYSYYLNSLTYAMIYGNEKLYSNVTYPSLKVAFLENGGFMKILKIGVLFLQLFSLPTKASILKPYRNLSRVHTKLKCELVLPFRLKFMLNAEIFLKKINLLSTELSLLGGAHNSIFVSLASWLGFVYKSIQIKRVSNMI